MDAAGLERKLGQVIADATSPAVLKDLGERLSTSVADAVRDTPVGSGRSLTDLSMSGWPVELVGKARVIGAGQVAITPEGKAVGQMRLLESGRRDYAKGDRRNSGTYRSKKTGEVRQKTRKVKQNVTGHGGKGTWTDATNRMRDRLPGEFAARFDGVMARFFQRG